MALNTALAAGTMAGERAAVDTAMPVAAVCTAQEDVVVGGKAAGLLRLQAIGATVPAFFVVPAQAFADHVCDASIGVELDRLLAGLADVYVRDDEAAARNLAERDAPALCAAIAQTPLRAALGARLAAEVDHLGAGPYYAVRSSMVGEDAAKHSFAGQLESYLFQRTMIDIEAAVRRCWASALAARVLLYRLRAGFGSGMPRMGVVVQRMIHGHTSGVTFTAHPTTGRRSHMLVTAAWGVGEGIVSGLCNTDEYVVSRQPGYGAGAGAGGDASVAEVSVRVADKDICVTAPCDGSAGTTQVAVAPEQRTVRCLDGAQLQRVARECGRIADAFGAPQDLEWTMARAADGQDALYILQSRPITSLPVPDNDDGPVVVFDNSNIQESYCGVTTPLTFSFAARAYASVYEQTMRAVGRPESEIVRYRPVLRNLLGLVRGRVYYNINNWYRGLLLLPSFGRNKADMEKMMGLEVEVAFVRDEKLGVGDKIRMLPRMARLVLRIGREFRRLKREVPRWLEQFAAAYRGVDRQQLRGASFSHLIGILATLQQRMLAHWHTPIINDFYVMMATGRLRRLVQSSGVGKAQALVNILLTGDEGIESTAPTRFLMRLARQARDDDGLRARLSQGEPQAAWAAVRRARPDFARDLDVYIERYGDRCMGELKLETVSLREDPTFVVQVLRNYVDRPDLDPDHLAAREQAARLAAQQQVAARLPWWRRVFLGRVVRQARAAVCQRENMRLARTRMVGLFRDVYRALGERLAEVGQLDAPRDIFYLTADEIEAYHDGRAASVALAAIANVRKAEFAAYRAQELPHHFQTRGPVYHGNRYRGPDGDAPVDTSRRVLRGTGCYDGVVEGLLRVIHSPEDELSVGGKILTTLRTDPGWAPLFPTCSGILVERGSTLSHSAVVARELGIPAVVGVPNLLHIVRDGERVRLDGGRGIVERLDVAVDVAVDVGGGGADEQALQEREAA